MDIATAFGLMFGLLCVVRSIMSSPMRIFERPVPWTEMLSKGAYFLSVVSFPKAMPRPQQVRMVSPPSWVVG